MNILVTIILIIAALLALLLLAGLFLKKVHFVKRDILINAPLDKVFDFLRFVKNQEQYNKWATTDANRQEEHKGTDGTVGYVYSWKGNKDAGEGQKEIMELVEGKKVVTEIRFTKPMPASALMIMETESKGDNQTQVYFTNTGRLKYPFNIFIPVFEKKFGKHMEESLGMLKKVIE